MSEPQVLCERRDDGVAVLRLNRPPLNPLSRALLAQLTMLATDLAGDPSVKAVVLVGSEYWRGMVDWLRGSMAREGNIHEEDLELLTIVDSAEDAVRAVREGHNRVLGEVLAEQEDVANGS